jgi:hypothetical protein
MLAHAASRGVLRLELAHAQWRRSARDRKSEPSIGIGVVPSAAGRHIDRRHRTMGPDVLDASSDVAASGSLSAMYRMRLTNRSGSWTCEATANGLTPASMALTKVVTGPLFISLRAENMESHVHAVSAESSATLFAPDVQADLDARGCTIAACHGASGTGAVMVVKASATTQTDIDANYASVMAEVNATTPTQSPLLTKPLTGSGVTHSGTKPFASTSDPTYVRWLNWIQAGAPKQ